jgi:hypothetical protein
MAFDPATANIDGMGGYFQHFERISSRGFEKRQFRIWSNVLTRSAVERLIEDGAGFRNHDDGTKSVSKRTTNEIY